MLSLVFALILCQSKYNPNPLHGRRRAGVKKGLVWCSIFYGQLHTCLVISTGKHDDAVRIDRGDAHVEL